MDYCYCDEPSKTVITPVAIVTKYNTLHLYYS